MNKMAFLLPDRACHVRRATSCGLQCRAVSCRAMTGPQLEPLLVPPATSQAAIRNVTKRKGNIVVTSMAKLSNWISEKKS